MISHILQCVRLHGHVSVIVVATPQCTALHPFIYTALINVKSEGKPLHLLLDHVWLHLGWRFSSPYHKCVIGYAERVKVWLSLCVSVCSQETVWWKKRLVLIQICWLQELNIDILIIYKQAFSFWINAGLYHITNSPCLEFGQLYISKLWPFWSFSKSCKMWNVWKQKKRAGQASNTQHNCD